MTTSAAFLSLLVALSLRMRCSTTLSRGLSAAIPWDRSQGCCTQRKASLRQCSLMVTTKGHRRAPELICHARLAHAERDSFDWLIPFHLPEVQLAALLQMADSAIAGPTASCQLRKQWWEACKDKSRM